MPRPKKKGRIRGANITNNEKAEILLRKDLRRSTGITNKDIAKDMKLSDWAVSHTHLYNVSDEVLDLYEKKKERLAAKALDVTYVALEKSGELIQQATDPKSLSGIAAAGKFADAVYRLETGQPTQITANQGPENHALEFIRMLMNRMDRDSALNAFKQASLEPLVPELRKAEILSRIESGELKLLGA